MRRCRSCACLGTSSSSSAQCGFHQRLLGRGEPRVPDAFIFTYYRIPYVSCLWCMAVTLHYINSSMFACKALLMHVRL
jgi:hypothetical protein